MKLLFVIIPLALAGCGAVQARDDAFNARDQYVACTKQQPAVDCNSLWQAYQVKRQHYLEAMGAD